MRLRSTAWLAVVVGFAATCFAGAQEVRTLEDLFGDTGNTFQAAIGFVNFEGTAANQALQSYGLGIDDMVVKWREFTLTEDATDCATGSCAAIDFQSTNLFDGNSSLLVQLVESSPLPTNDCDLDGSDDGTDDCDQDGVRDLVVLATSAAEIEGEIVILNLDPGQSDRYSGSLTISTLGDTDPGILFVAQQGGDLPTVTVTYNDLDDGTGEICKNDVDPAKWGKVQATTTVFFGPTCEIVVLGAQTVDNGDGDEFVDTAETVEMRIEYANRCGFELHDCVARIASNSPEVDCIITPIISLGDLAPDFGYETHLSSGAFLWKMADLERSSLEAAFDAAFNVSISCAEIDGLSIPQTVNLPLDLDLDDLGQTSTTWTEDFESGTLGKFAPQNLDAGLPGNNHAEGLANADGWRCQSHDPDWPNSASYGSDQTEVCYPGNNLAHANAVYWQVDGLSVSDSPDGGRAFTGNHSMYYGVFLLTPAGEFSSPLAVVESVATTDPINLGVGNDPTLGFWHQVSLLDDRALGGVPPLRSADRGVVQIQLADDDGPGTPLSPWIKLEPFQNTYDETMFDWHFNCMFDPIDDGSTEDDFFDPTDPNRRSGPSSTCYPEQTFGYLGDTDGSWSVTDVGNATTPPTPADVPDLGVGTWVESRFDLSEYRGRRIRLRFLVSSLKATQENWEDQFAINPDPRDDGWWIDAIQIDDTLLQPALLLLDTKQLRSCQGDPDVGCLSGQDCVDAGVSGPCDGIAPQCGETCNTVTVGVETVPDTDASPLTEELPAPGQVVQLNAVNSVADRCLDGTLLYRFLSDGAELRGWSDNPIFVAAPQAALDIEVQVRCSSDPSCQASAIVDVDVDCPKASPGPLFPTIRAATVNTWSWTDATDYEVFRGDSTAGFYAGAGFASGNGTSFVDPDVPASGVFRWYVARIGAEFCNETGAWSSGGPAELPQRESTLP